MSSESQLVEKTECPCGKSSDAFAVYDDGHGHCFSCDKHFPKAGDSVTEAPATPKKKKARDMLPPGEFEALPNRGLREATCRKYNYFTSEFAGKPAQVAQYYDDEGKPCAQKVRMPGKDFTVLGDMSRATLYGQHLWRHGGRRVVVTEGEIDALSVAQAMGLSWPAVSVPNGAAGAVKAIQKNLEWLQSHEEVIFMFDADEPGRKAAQECAELFPPGKAKVVFTPGYKDANEMLKADKSKDLANLVWEAKVVRPDGIINGSDVWDQVNTAVERGLSYPFKGLDDCLYGARGGEIVTITAGSGIGKSAITREIGYHFGNVHGQKVGYVALEENCGRTARGFMGLHLSKPIHLPGVDVTAAERKAAFDATMGTGRYWFYDHFGSLESDNLISKLRFLVKGCDVKWLVLDHISIVVSGMDEDSDERKTIDRLMTKLRSFTEETGAGLFLVSHLRRPSGDRGHEEGAVTSVAQLRGSHAIAQLSDVVIGAERNQQADDRSARDVMLLRVLKNRYTGETGPVSALRYGRDTGRLTETKFSMGEDGQMLCDEAVGESGGAFD